MKESEEQPWPELESKPEMLRDSADLALPPSVTVRDAKTHLSAILDWVAGGREVTITSDGKPKARLVPNKTESRRKVFGGMGNYLSNQQVHGGPGAEELVRQDRDGRGW